MNTTCLSKEGERHCKRMTSHEECQEELGCEESVQVGNLPEPGFSVMLEPTEGQIQTSGMFQHVSFIAS